MAQTNHRHLAECYAAQLKDANQKLADANSKIMELETAVADSEARLPHAKEAKTASDALAERDTNANDEAVVEELKIHFNTLNAQLQAARDQEKADDVAAKTRADELAAKLTALQELSSADAAAAKATIENLETRLQTASAVKVPKTAQANRGTRMKEVQGLEKKLQQQDREVGKLRKQAETSLDAKRDLKRQIRQLEREQA